MTQTKSRTVGMLLLTALFGFDGNLAHASPCRLESWLTDPSAPDSEALKAQVEARFHRRFASEKTDAVGSEIRLLPEQRRQVIDGFGGSLTEATVVNLLRLSEAARLELLREIFDSKTGMGHGYIRIPIGASDFAEGDYTYNDIPPGETDLSLSRFSIERDRKTIELVKEIRKINPGLRVMLSPWSAPVWMKRKGDSINGGSLDPLYYEAYSRYLIKAIQEYERAGVPIDTFTVQNEPLNPTHYPSMKMTAAEQAKLIRNHLGPLMKREKLKAKLVVFDHNWKQVDYSLEVLSDSRVRSFVSGVAFHGYDGVPEDILPLIRRYPKLGIYQTEISCLEVDRKPPVGVNLKDLTARVFRDHLIPSLETNSRAYIFWNLILDEKNGPRNRGWEGVRPLIQIEKQTGKILRQPEYVLLGHLSRFVIPGARRIELKRGRKNALDSVAFVNPDNSRVAVVSNSSDQAQSYRLVDPQCGTYEHRLAPFSTVSFRWNTR